MSKLRQKNPGAIRSPEEDKGLETFLMDSRILVGTNSVNAISPHINRLCNCSICGVCDIIKTMYIVQVHVWQNWQTKLNRLHIYALHC